MGEILLVVSQVITSVVTWLLAALLVVRFIRDRSFRAAWLPTLATLSILVATFAGSIAPNSGPAGLWFSAIWFAAFPTLFFTYPNGRFMPRWTILPAATTAASAAAYVVTGSAIAELAWWPWLLALQVSLGLGALLFRYSRRLSIDERLQVRWPLVTTLISIGGFTVITIIENGTVAEHGPSSVAAANLAGLFIPVGFAVGLWRPRILNVDVALRGVLVLAFAIAPLALTVIGVVALGNAMQLGGNTAWAVAVAVAIVGAVSYRYAPRLADWLVYRGRPDPLASLRELGRRLDGQVDLDELPSSLVGLVSEALHLESVELRGSEAGALRSRNATNGGVSDAPTTEFPIVYRGEELARLIVTPRQAETTLTAHDVAVIAELCGQAAPALHGARTVQELLDARERVLEARERERARLRRDLHDDLAPTLVGIDLSAAAIAEISRGDRPDIHSLAERMRADARAALAQTRELANDLRPDELEQEGLLGTLRRRFPRDGLVPSVQIDGPTGELHLDPLVEVAALRIAQEAVTNVRRHAAASECRVAVRLAGHSLELEVVDNGIGLPANPRQGLGLLSMSERASELGGHAVVSRQVSGGTRVLVTLPLVPRRDGVLS